MLSARVPKVRRKGPCSPAIFREICSAILGPSKLAAERISVHFMHLMETNRPIRLTQCCTQFKSPGEKILCVLHLHYNVAFTFK